MRDTIKALLVFTILISALINANAFAAYGGTTGIDCRWDLSDEGDLVIKGEAKYETDQVAINNPKYTLEDKYRLPGEYGKEFYFELTFAFDEDRNTVYIKKGIYRFLWKRNLAIGYKNQTVDDIIAGDFDLGHC
jgi:hypothetical protein